MSSMGFLLADWSIELIRSRKRREKKQNKNKKHRTEQEQQTEASTCLSCDHISDQLSQLSEQLSQKQLERERLAQLLQQEDVEDMVEEVERMVTETNKLRAEAEQLQVEGRQLAESVGRQLTDRDLEHSKKVKALEILMAEKERQMLQASNELRGQLAAAKKETKQLTNQLSQLEIVDGSRGTAGTDSWQQEVESLQLVIEMKREEVDQLKSANNSLRLELERLGVVELQLQVERQRTEEMNAVIHIKNDQLHQVLDEYDAVQHQLEIEVSAHLCCQQELEKVKWTRDSFIADTSSLSTKNWKNLTNRKESAGLVMDVVAKDKGVAYSFNC